MGRLHKWNGTDPGDHSLFQAFFDLVHGFYVIQFSAVNFIKAKIVTGSEILFSGRALHSKGFDQWYSTDDRLNHKN